MSTMTLKQVRDRLRGRGEFYRVDPVEERAMADAIDAHLAPPAPSRITACTTQEVVADELKKTVIHGLNPAQPARAVDVGVIREVIDALRNMGGKPNNIYNLAADKLTRALSGEIAGPVEDGWKLAMFVLQSGLYNKLPEEERAVCDALVQQNPYLPASPAPDKEG